MQYSNDSISQFIRLLFSILKRQETTTDKIKLKANEYEEYSQSSIVFSQERSLNAVAMRLGTVVPNFKAQTTHGPIQFYDWQGSS